MKKVGLLAVAFLMSVVLFAQDAVQAPTSKAKIEFEETSKDFGDIYQGDAVTHVFKFKNTGTEPLVLSNVITSCGCTATEWPRDPIAPGATGEINATFNSRGKMGKQNKVITVVSNSMDGSAKVTIISNVLPPKAGAPAQE